MKKVRKPWKLLVQMLERYPIETIQQYLEKRKSFQGCTGGSKSAIKQICEMKSAMREQGESKAVRRAMYGVHSFSCNHMIWYALEHKILYMRVCDAYIVSMYLKEQKNVYR